MKNRNLDHKDHWATPPQFKTDMYEEFGIDFDPCPWYHNIDEWDGLEIEWGERNFINPPYSLKLKEAFVRKALKESRKSKLCVLLLPVSTSTKLFHEVIEPNAVEIRFIKGRLPFIGINSKGQYVNYHLIQDISKPDFTHVDCGGRLYPKYIKNSGQQDSMIAIFDGRY